jgi:hypothetical protein
MVHVGEQGTVCPADLPVGSGNAIRLCCACQRSESTIYRTYAESLQRWESSSPHSDVALFR